MTQAGLINLQYCWRQTEVVGFFKRILTQKLLSFKTRLLTAYLGYCLCTIVNTNLLLTEF